MSINFDVIVVGSGAAGVSAAFPLVEAGLRVLMIDGGKSASILPPMTDFLSARSHDITQWKWMVGSDFRALNFHHLTTPKLRVPTQTYVFDEFIKKNQIKENGFVSIGSLATGGLTNAWGCGVAQFSATELSKFPVSASEFRTSYARVSQRIGVSGRNDDDLAEYFGFDDNLLSPIALDHLNEKLLSKYIKKRANLNNLGFKLGRSRIAALSSDINDRRACNLSGNCLFGCSRGSLYSASHDLHNLRKNRNFFELNGFLVDSLHQTNDSWSITGKSDFDREQRSIKAKKVILAAGTLATTRLVLSTLNKRGSVPMLSSPTAAFMLWRPGSLSSQRLPSFGLGQLSYTLSLQNDITAFGSTFATTGIPMSEFIRHLPMSGRYGADLLKGLLNSCVVVNLFLPGNLTNAAVQIDSDGALLVTGSYNDCVESLMTDIRKRLFKAFCSIGALILPGSFKIGAPGSDIHYAGTLPMRTDPGIGETSMVGELRGMNGVYVVDGASLPILPAKSHTLTIMANADRIGRHLAAIILK